MHIMSFSFMYRGVLYVHHVHVGACGRQNALDPLELKLEVASYHVGAGNQTWVVYKNKYF